jgi:hypothetical protein
MAKKPVRRIKHADPVRLVDIIFTFPQGVYRLRVLDDPAARRRNRSGGPPAARRRNRSGGPSIETGDAYAYRMAMEALRTYHPHVDPFAWTAWETVPVETGSTPGALRTFPPVRLMASAHRRG